MSVLEEPLIFNNILSFLITSGPNYDNYHIVCKLIQISKYFHILLAKNRISYKFIKYLRLAKYSHDKMQEFEKKKNWYTYEYIPIFDGTVLFNEISDNLYNAMLYYDKKIQLNDIQQYKCKNISYELCVNGSSQKFVSFLVDKKVSILRMVCFISIHNYFILNNVLMKIKFNKDFFAHHPVSHIKFGYYVNGKFVKILEMKKLHDIIYSAPNNEKINLMMAIGIKKNHLEQYQYFIKNIKLYYLKMNIYLNESYLWSVENYIRKTEKK